MPESTSPSFAPFCAGLRRASPRLRAARFLQKYLENRRARQEGVKVRNSLHSGGAASSKRNRMAELTVPSTAPRIGPLNMWKKVFFAFTLLVGIALFAYF